MTFISYLLNLSSSTFARTAIAPGSILRLPKPLAVERRDDLKPRLSILALSLKYGNPEVSEGKTMSRRANTEEMVMTDRGLSKNFNEPGRIFELESFKKEIKIFNMVMVNLIWKYIVSSMIHSAISTVP